VTHLSGIRRDAVLDATTRTTHVLRYAEIRDERYSSSDPAIDALWRALQDVADPELPISLVDLGLICDIRRSEGNVDVDLTFTASACPCMEFIIMDITERLMREEGITAVRVTDVWDPPWNTDRMTAHGKAQLKTFGVAA